MINTVEFFSSAFLVAILTGSTRFINLQTFKF